MSGTENRRESLFKSKVKPMLSKMRGRILQDKYFNAIYLRNIPEITRCLNKGVNPNVRSSEYGVAPLHLLAERNDYILGYRLLECKDVNADLKSVHGYTALHIACNFNCKRFVGLLLQKGADPNLCDRLNKSPLHIAVERESYGIILKLLKAKANVNVLDCFENTPLSVGIVNVNNLLIVKTLLQYGVNMSIEHRRSLHIFFEAILNCRSINQIDFIMLLLENGVNINTRETKTGRNCLHFVAITGYLELAVVLVQKGAKWNAIDTRYRSPAKVAMEHGNEILADYFRKGYRPPNLLTTLPLVYLWTSKLKLRLTEKRAQQEQGHEHDAK